MPVTRVGRRPPSATSEDIPDFKSWKKRRHLLAGEEEAQMGLSGNATPVPTHPEMVEMPLLAQPVEPTVGMETPRVNTPAPGPEFQTPLPAKTGQDTPFLNPPGSVGFTGHPHVTPFGVTPLMATGDFSHGGGMTPGMTPGLESTAGMTPMMPMSTGGFTALGMTPRAAGDVTPFIN